MRASKGSIPFFGAVGMALGAGLGVFADAIPQGVGAGLAIGVGFGALRERMMRQRLTREQAKNR
jgi:hypothetical protein